MNKDCKIVQDLLPSYIDGLTNKETNEFIEGHIKECKECQNALNGMREKLLANTDKAETNKVRYLKKYNREVRVLQILLLVILIGFIGNVARKYLIIESLYNKFNETNQNSDNYYYKSDIYTLVKDWPIDDTKERKGSILLRETYYKDGNFVTTFKYALMNDNVDNRCFIYYKKDNEEQALMKQTKDGKTILSPITFLGDIKNMALKQQPIYHEENFFKNLYVAIFEKVEKIDMEGKKCYMIKNKYGDNIYVDALTGMIVKTVNIKDDTISNTYFEAGNVKDSDIAIPDM